MDSDLRGRLQAALGDGYCVERELGGGGMSRVFMAEETRLRRRVVVKVLAPELAQEISSRRFEREMRTTASLQQANIVPVLAAGDAGGLPYYTMPFVEGESLRSRLAQGRLPIAEVIGIVRDVAKALAYAHDHGVVHRDIKPSNVLLSGGTAVVTDFGIAKAVSAARSTTRESVITLSGTSIGTPAYMAPEQALGDPTLDHRADIYSLGCLAYELLAGRPPFSDRAPQRTLAAHLAEAPHDIARLRPDAPKALTGTVMACLAKNPDARPQSAVDVIRRLDAITPTDGNPALLDQASGMLRKAILVYVATFFVVALLARLAIVWIGLPNWVLPGALVVMALGLPMVLWTAYVQWVTHQVAANAAAGSTANRPSVITHGTLATLALKAAPHVSWYRTAKGQAYALAGFVVMIAAFMAMRVLGIGPAASLLTSGQLAAHERILLTDFASTNGDTGLATAVGYAVRRGLEGSPVLSIVGQAETADWLQMMELARTTHVDLPLARQLALRLGAKAIVDAVVTPVGREYVLTLRLLTSDSLRTLASFQETGADVAGVIDAADRITRDLRGKAGESLRSVHAAPPVAAATTASIPALLAYSDGARALSVEHDYPKAIRFLREAVAIDTTFAEAWRALGIVLQARGFPRSRSGAALERAYAFRARTPESERLYIEATYHAWGPHADREKAIAVYERMVARDLPRGRNNLAALLMLRRDFTRAESLLRSGLRLAPSSLLEYGNLVEALTDEGRLDVADSVVRTLAGRFPEATAVRQWAAGLRYQRQDLDGYGRAVDSARRNPDPTHPAWALQQSAALALLQGRLAAWRQFRRRAAAADSAAGFSRTPIADAITASWVYTMAYEEPDTAIGRLAAALAHAPLRRVPDADRPDLAVAAAYARAGRPDTAREILDRYRAEVRDTATRRINQPEEHTALAEIALSQHRWGEALDQFRRADRLPDGPATDCTICLQLNLARTFYAAGMADSAIAEFESYVNTPYALRLTETLDAVALPFAHERLGQLYESAGNAEEAEAHYRQFIALWDSADAQLRPRVARARQRLLRLSTPKGTGP